MLGVAWVPRKLPGKGLPGAAPSIVSSARGTTAIAWRRKETQTREKEGSAKQGSAGGQAAGLLPQLASWGHHKASPSPAESSRFTAGPEAALGRRARARPTTPPPEGPDTCSTMHLPRGGRSWSGGACAQGLA